MATINSSLKVPETIEGCLNLLRDIEKGGVLAIPRGAHDDWNRVRRKMSDLCDNRVQDIKQIIVDCPGGGTTCVPDSVGHAFLSYALYQNDNRFTHLPYDKRLYYSFLARRGVEEYAVFEYVNGEDDGYPEYGYIRIPTDWLTCTAVTDLRKNVLVRLFQDLCNYIQKLENDFSASQKAHTEVAIALTKYMPMEEVSKLVPPKKED